MVFKSQPTNGKMYRIHGSTARKFFNSGGEIFIAGVGEEPKNARMMCHDLPFDRQVSVFRYQKCQKNTGYYPAFYFMVKVG